MNDSKVICIKGDNSNWYEQAIFILNKKSGKKNVPVDLVSEAERIVSGYYERTYNYKNPSSIPAANSKNKSGKAFDITMNIIMLTCCIALAGVLMWSYW